MDDKTLAQDFQNLDANNTDACDTFFGKYGVGNNIIKADHSLERLTHYEDLLTKLLNINPQKYIECHKGTPYYFLGWLCFDMGHFSRAYFYFDLAIYEDRWHLHPNEPNKWMEDPGAEIMLVKEDGKGSAGRVRKKNYETITMIINMFTHAIDEGVTIDKFGKKFLKKVIHSSLNPSAKKNYRPIICSMFSFFIMYESRLSDLKLRATQSGSIEPFITHLFLGCLIFESLMKMKYADRKTKTLGGYIDKAIKLKDLGIQKKIYKANKTHSFQDIINNLKNLEKKGSFGEVCVGISYMIRNTTGHSLNWPDKFNEEIYEKLFRHISNAILWLIFKKYLT